MKKVFIGVGHGGADSGAVGNGLKEKDLNLAVASACSDELKRNGVTVQMSRTKDEEDTLNQEVAECNKFAPDLAVDIHNNAGGGDGVECWYSIFGGTGKTLAENILKEVTAIGQNSRGAKTKKNPEGKDYYGFVRMTKAPAVIVECAFIDNKTDISIIDTAAEQKAMGVAIAKGILKTLGISNKPIKAEVTVVRNDPVSVIYQIWDDVKNCWLPNVKDPTDFAGIFGHDVCAVAASLSKGNIYYKIHTKGGKILPGKWLPEVKNREDFAGIKNKPIDGLMMRTDTGRKIHYAVHLRKKNKWLPFVTGYSAKDPENGYAGIIGQEIDGVKIYID